MSAARHLSILLLLLLPTMLSAQRQNNIWYFGRQAGIDFNGPLPVALNDGVLGAYEGTSSIADRHTGELLFYTDGKRVWNRRHQQMPRGSGLAGHLSSSQSALIVPMPGDTLRYYIFTTDGVDDDVLPRNGASYSIVDMSLAGGLGDIAVLNTPLLAPTIESLCGVQICRENEYWVMVHGFENDFYAYRVSSRGVDPPVISNAGAVRNADFNSAIGYMAFSPDGSKLAVADFGGCCVEIFDFDITSGIVSSAASLPLESPRPGIYGICFSPDNSKLYVSQLYGPRGVVQFDLSAGTLAAIISSRTHLSTRRAGALQIGPDNRIYISVDEYVDIINFPNQAGAACSYSEFALDLSPGASTLSLPNLVISNVERHPFNAAPADTICPGETTQLSATGAMIYRWYPEKGLSCTDCPTPQAAPEATTTYFVEATDGGPCRLVDSVTVIVRPFPTVSAGSGGSICRGDSLPLFSSGAGLYSWSPAAGLSCTDCPNPIASPDTTTVYTLTVSGMHCMDTDTVQVVVVDLPVASVSSDTSVCLTDSVQLQASGGLAYRWSPAAGLTCTECPSPVASPDTTTTYIVTVTGSGGCESSDQVVVRVDRGLIAHAYVSRDVSIRPGNRINIPVVLEDPLDDADVSSIELELRYNAGIMRLEQAIPGSLGGTLVELENSPGIYRGRLSAPAGSMFNGIGDLIRLEFLTYLGDSTAGDITMIARIPSHGCTRIISTPGRIMFDSLCMLDSRMIEAFPAKFTLEQNRPNPSGSTTTIDFSVPLEGWTRLVIFDETGREVKRFIDGIMIPGSYRVEVDARELLPGVYTYRLESAGYTQTRRMIVVR